MTKDIVVVEPERWAAELYAQVIAAEGYRVRMVRTAAAAIETLMNERAAALVTDLFLPGYNGVQLLHELQSYPDLARMPVIIYSAVDSRQVGLSDAAWRQYGVVAYCNKLDVRPQTLARRLREYAQ